MSRLKKVVMVGVLILVSLWTAYISVSKVEEISEPNPSQLRYQAPLPTLRYRDSIGAMLESDPYKKHKVGAELGVQSGLYTRKLLADWKGAEEFWLVDVWRQQANYADSANGDNSHQEMIFNTAINNTRSWSSSIRVCRNFTTVCVEKFPDSYFDFIYVDARHDFKGVLIDIDEWWSKLKINGIFAGHDYVSMRDMRAWRLKKKQRWDINYDGTLDTTQTIVQGAVDLFFTDTIWGVDEHKLEELRQLIRTPKHDRMRSIKLTYKDLPGSMSWFCRK